jgi:hypothetical protein
MPESGPATPRTVRQALSPRSFSRRHKGLTLAQGAVDNDNGRAIVSDGTNLTIRYCVIAGNRATG